MEITKNNQERKFNSPQEELEYLREQVATKEREHGGTLEQREQYSRDVLGEYKAKAPEQVLEAPHRMTGQELKAVVLDLAPEAHDAKVSELLGILNEKGIKNVLSVLEHMNNPHLEDDFERFLVQYIKGGFTIEGLKAKNPLFKALSMTLYEIALPLPEEKEKERALKEIISSMEQFYAGMLSVYGELASGPNYFTIELAVSNHSDEFIFYSAVPDSKRNLFEKQILSIFPNAKINEKKDDYNIFEENGVTLASTAELKKNAIFPIKTYEQFDHDPLSVILNSFSKIDKDGEGAAIQIIIRPAGEVYTTRYKGALEKIKKGVKVKEAIDIPETFGDEVFHFVKDIFKDTSKQKKEKEEKEKNEHDKPDDIVIENIQLKIKSPIVRTNIRIVASSSDEAGATEILSDLESAFNQFENTNGNRIVFKRLKRSALAGILRSFSFRLFSEADTLPLSLREVTTLMHLPSTTAGTESAPQLKISKAGTAPAPIGLPNKGTLLGINRDRNVETKIFMMHEDRLRHFYTIGQTGTGKTTLLKNMIAQDILAGDGVCMIDPHGTDIQDVLAIIPPERYEDVIYFDPGYAPRPMGLNMLEFDRRFPEQKTFVVNEMLSIFDKLFDMKTAGGPMFEQYFRNSVLLVLEDPDSGSTLIDVSRVLSDKKFRELKLSKCRNPIVVQFWREVAEKAGGESALANIVPYITSKFDTFLSNEIMRPIIAQEHSSFNFREIMDEKKILLVNLSKGRLGDINSHLIGLILVGKILMAALSRVDSVGGELPPFYLYIDEFQNITTNSIATILSEARKYKLSLNIAHQFIKQLDEKIKDAVFGNVGSIASFRVGAEDAEFLEKQFKPVFSAKDIMNLDNRNAYLKILVDGRPVKPFNIETLPPPKGRVEQVDQLKELSYLKFGRERAVVEGEVMARYQKASSSEKVLST